MDCLGQGWADHVQVATSELASLVGQASLDGQGAAIRGVPVISKAQYFSHLRTSLSDANTSCLSPGQRIVHRKFCCLEPKAGAVGQFQAAHTSGPGESSSQDLWIKFFKRLLAGPPRQVVRRVCRR
jgi:hypothetical protein